MKIMNRPKIENGEWIGSFLVEVSPDEFGDIMIGLSNSANTVDFEEKRRRKARDLAMMMTKVLDEMYKERYGND